MWALHDMPGQSKTIEAGGWKDCQERYLWTCERVLTDPSVCQVARHRAWIREAKAPEDRRRVKFGDRMVRIGIFRL